MVEKLLSLPSPRPKGLFFLLEAAFLVLGGPFSPSAWPLERGALLVVRRGTRPFPLSKDRLYATLFFAPFATDGRMKEKGPNNCVSPFAGKHAPLSLSLSKDKQGIRRTKSIEEWKIFVLAPLDLACQVYGGSGWKKTLNFHLLCLALSYQPASASQ